MWKILLMGVTLLSASVASVHAQDWSAVRALPPNTPVRVTELGSAGRETRGRISAVDDSQLLLLRGGKIVPVLRTSIARIDEQKRDPIWEGLLFGALYGVVMRLAFADEACARAPDPQCTIAGIGLSAAAGGFIDFQIRGYRRIYDGPGTTVMLFRLSF